MTDVGKWLRAGDPLAGDPRLDEDAARAMRRAILVQRRTAVDSDAWWPRPVAVAATIAITLGVGAAVGRRLPPPHGSMQPAATNQPSAPGERRQLQFSTPGGTRIVWIFDSNLQL